MTTVDRESSPVFPSEPAPSWEERDPETGRHARNGHVILLVGLMWRCENCFHYFDAAVEANEFICGKDCSKAHERYRCTGR